MKVVNRRSALEHDEKMIDTTLPVHLFRKSLKKNREMKNDFSLHKTESDEKIAARRDTGTLTKRKAANPDITIPQKDAANGIS